MSDSDNFHIARGAFSDYRRLSRFHYRGNPPRAVVGVWRVTLAGRSVVDRCLGRYGEPSHPVVVGVLTVSMPRLSSTMRTLATAGRYTGLSPREKSTMFNRELRTISRVIIDPRWRGRGLAVRLVQHALRHAETPYTEAFAAMGTVNPFFERAGMTRYDPQPPPNLNRLSSALEHVGIHPQPQLCGDELLRWIEQLEDDNKRFIETEFNRWFRTTRRLSGREAGRIGWREKCNDYLDCLWSRPVYYLFSKSI